MAAELVCDVAGTNTEWDRNAHIVALFTIVGTSAVGVFLPIVWQTIRGLNPMNIPVLPIQLGQFFGAGVIIATAFLHLLPAANNALSSPCLAGFADRYSAWAFLIALATVFSMHTIEWWLVEAWASRTSQPRRGGGRRRRRLAPTASGIDNSNSDSDVAGANYDDDDDDNDMLFPDYSRRYNASRMMMQPPAVSPPVNPFVFGASTVSPSLSAGIGLAHSTCTSRQTGFMISRYGNYAALIQSRQQLALVQGSRQSSRYLYSDPQFPLYAPSSIWPVPPPPPPPMPGSYGNPVRGYAQAKSTPELLRKHTKSTRKSNRSSAISSSYGKDTSSTNAISLRPDSFSNAVNPKRKSRNRQSTTGMIWKQKCLSMPRLPPTTLEAGLCDSLLEPFPPPLPDHGAQVHISPTRPHTPQASSSRIRHSGGSGWVSKSVHKSVSPYSVGRTNSRVSPRPISVALAASAKAATKRLSLQAVAVVSAANRCSGDRSVLTSPSAKLDTVHETDDAVNTSPHYRTSDDMSAGMVYASATSAIPPPSSMQRTFHTTRSQNRVSVPPPRVIRAAPSSCAFRSISATTPSNALVSGSELLASQQMPHGRSAVAGYMLQGAGHRAGSNMSPAGSEADGESTAIHSKLSVAGLSLPIEVKRRALATYILELGIVLYSVLVGLALAMSDSGFLALFIATCFHQFFEGLALGTSLAELYWIKAQLAAHSRITAGPAADIGMPQDPQTLDDDAQDETISVVAICGAARGRMHHAVDIDNPRHVSSGYQGHRRSASDCDSNVANVAPSILVDSQDFVHVSLPQQQQEQQHQQYHDRRSKSRRTLLSIATSFLPEPWLVNPQLEKTIGGNGCANGPKATSTTQPPDSAAAGVAAKRGADSTHAKLPRYLLPRKQPERLPGWWKAWVSALAFTLTTPTGIIIGLALRNVYVPHSQYALLFNGVLQSICTGILVYVGLVTLIFGGFNSAQVKQMRRLVQIMLFVAVYAGASAMASIKIWI